MKKIRLVAAAAALGLLAGCATRGTAYVPIIDKHDLGSAGLIRYEKDLEECQAYARQADSAAATAIAGAIAGALLGAALAPRGYRNDLAAHGAVLGTAAGAGQGVVTQETIIKRCLTGRGYRVLM